LRQQFSASCSDPGKRMRADPRCIEHPARRHTSTNLRLCKPLGVMVSVNAQGTAILER
jgi:hypothetical protein